MDFIEEIYKTIEVMFQRYISKMKISQQVNGVVIGESGKHDGKYKVKINGEVYSVKDGVGLAPAPNANVWVNVPNNDWNQAYICAGKNIRTGFVTEEEMISTRAALEAEIQEVYDECSQAAEITASKIHAVMQAGDNITLTESNRKLIVSAEFPGVMDVTVDGTSIVDEEDMIAKISSPTIPVTDVTLDGSSVLNGTIAQLTSPTIPVIDVEVDGVSVLNNGIAEITMPTILVKDVKVNSSSVVNSSGVANITVPSIPVTDVQVDNVSILNGTVAKLDSSDFGTTVVANPTGASVGDLSSVQIGNSIYDIPSGGGGGTTVVANPSGTASADLSKIQISNTIYGVATPTDISTLQSNFQAGVDSVYNACVAKGSTPASHSLSDVVTAIGNISGGTGDSIVFSSANGVIQLNEVSATTIFNIDNYTFESEAGGIE